VDSRERIVQAREWIDSLVSWLPAREREAALLMFVSQSFVDESQSELPAVAKPCFVMGGFVGGVEMWKSFATDWQKELDEPPKLPPFHAVDFNRPQNGFEVLVNKRRGIDLRPQRMARLLGVIEKHKPKAWLVQWRKKSYAETFGQLPKNSGEAKRMAHPHGLGALMILGRILRDNPPHHVEGSTLHPVFDTHGQSGGAAHDIFENEVRPYLRAELPHTAYMMEPTWPLPEHKHLYRPLQAADLLVWHQRRVHESSKAALLEPHMALVVQAHKRLFSMRPRPYVWNVTMTHLIKLLKYGLTPALDMGASSSASSSPSSP